ncbi:hypothetical protein HK096_006929, partial [Nowakowskiella sp. JEL0078]
MGDAGFYRGTTSEQDSRFADKKKKLLKSTKFAPILLKKVDLTKVKLVTMRQWITTKITSLLGVEDEIVINYVLGLLEQPDTPITDGREIQISLTTFLESQAPRFMEELWTLLVDAAENGIGIPRVIVEAKKEELRKEQAERERVVAGLTRQTERESGRRI